MTGTASFESEDGGVEGSQDYGEVGLGLVGTACPLYALWNCFWRASARRTTN